ncbi:MAG: DNA internalization-related competence protein ComEC/Rec2 [Thauera sp.]|jgi:competence protein ComEC|nr:DNA internalization-related competence protein ComEC/Rec2 [Thauera sp.]
MPAFAIFFVVGVFALQQQAELPAPAWLLGACLSGLLAWVLVVCCGAHQPVSRGRLLRPLALCLLATALGFAWAGMRAHERIANHLRGELEDVDLQLSGRIAGLPQPLDDHGWRFVFDLVDAPPGVPARLQLSWYRALDEAGQVHLLQAGEHWQFTVRLRRPHGMLNPHGFDYEARLFERNLRATGYVRSGAKRLDAQPVSLLHALDRHREAVRSRFNAVLADTPEVGILIALVIGEQRGIGAAQWEVFRRTGVAHLVAISGLHISLVAGFAAAALGLFSRWWPDLLFYWPRPRLQVLVAAAVAGVYALFAGMGIPVQRALIMLLIVATALLSGRRVRPAAVLALALLVVVLIDPWAVIVPGFWLSFGAVATIGLLMSGRRRSGGVSRHHRWWAAARLQLGINLTMLPLLLLLFQAFPLSAPLANAFAIPLTSFVIVPLSLLAAVSGFDFPLHWAAVVTVWMMSGLAWLAALDAAFWRQALPPWWLLLCAAVGVIWLVLPRPLPGRLCALLLLLALLSWPAPRPAIGTVKLRVLDVGQGLAVHVQTAHHDLLYDTGPRYGAGAGADAGERVILPYLRALGVFALDGVIVSHDDSDHNGGVASIAAAMPVAQWWASGFSAPVSGVTASFRLQSCAAGQSWQWDGVKFELLHPSPDAVVAPRLANDDSCVLKVSNAAGSVLLLGDLEKDGEAALLARHAPQLASDVVVSAHHGSRTSSTAALIAATLPEAVIHAVGHRSRFGHPHPQVWARWAAAGARNWRTDAQGAILITLDAQSGSGPQLESERVRRARYWHGH